MVLLLIQLSKYNFLCPIRNFGQEKTEISELQILLFVLNSLNCHRQLLRFEVSSLKEMKWMLMGKKHYKGQVASV